MKGISMISRCGAASSARGSFACGATAVVLLAAGCGASPSAAVAAAPRAGSGATVVAANGSATTQVESRARRLADFRRMIVRSYAVPGDGSPAGEDPLARLWHELARQERLLTM